jgi:hypothetical protein
MFIRWQDNLNANAKAHAFLFRGIIDQYISVTTVTVVAHTFGINSVISATQGIQSAMVSTQGINSGIEGTHGIDSEISGTQGVESLI